MLHILRAHAILPTLKADLSSYFHSDEPKHQHAVALQMAPTTQVRGAADLAHQPGHQLHSWQRPAQILDRQQHLGWNCCQFDGPSGTVHTAASQRQCLGWQVAG